VFTVTGTQLTENGEFDPGDLDDGMDVDELDGGSLIGNVLASDANDNFEQGWDFNENDAGDFRVDMTSCKQAATPRKASTSRKTTTSRAAAT
jgi:hypothetical protein